jgi:DNA-binding SARP family transcriptional activator
MGRSRSRLKLLGPISLEIDGIAQPLGGPRQRAVLALLALEHDRLLTVDRLIVELWDHDDLRQPKNNVQVYVSNLRRVLRPVEDELALVSETGGYRLVTAPGTVDLHQFEDLVGLGRGQLERGLPQAAARTLREADALWAGGLVDDLAVRFDVFADLANVAREKRLHALELQMTAGLRAGMSGELVASLERLTVLHPLRERFWILLVTALARNSRQSDALNAVQRARRALAEEAGLEPCDELIELESTILSGRVPGGVVEVSGMHLRYVDGAGVEIRVPLVLGGSYDIGRQDSLDISIPWDGQASRVHARVHHREGGWWIADRGSTNGTKLNGAAVTAETRLALGDVFVVGTTVFSVMEPAPVGSAATTSATIQVSPVAVP